MRASKAQVSMEFVFLIVLGFMIFIVFSVVAREQIFDVAEKKEFIMLKDVTYMVQAEINSAFSVEDGYERIFFLPDELNEEEEYEIYIRDNFVISNTSTREFMVRIQSINGDLVKGNNTLRKYGGALYLN